MKKKNVCKAAFLVLLCLLFTGAAGVFVINAYVKATADDCILSPETAAKLTDVDAILILGCGVRSDGTPSAMLEDRLNCGIALYQAEVSPKLLMSGDHGQKEYDEVGTMKQYATDAGIPSENIFMDHAGFSTYESMYRAKEIFAADKIVIVTQSYHLYRAIYIANALGIEAYGVSADYRTYAGQTYRDVRELLARCKDLATTLFKPEPTYLGEVIPVSGNGNLTNEN